jgi:hypothetical protein
MPCCQVCTPLHHNSQVWRRARKFITLALCELNPASHVCVQLTMFLFSGIAWQRTGLQMKKNQTRIQQWQAQTWPGNQLSRWTARHGQEQSAQTCINRASSRYSKRTPHVGRRAVVPGRGRTGAAWRPPRETPPCHCVCVGTTLLSYSLVGATMVPCSPASHPPPTRFPTLRRPARVPGPGPGLVDLSFTVHPQFILELSNLGIVI